MQITAAMVKELRDLTGAGMMECKKALTEVGGKTEAAIEWMRKNGLAQAEKKAGRIAAEGVISVVVNSKANVAGLIEINCETDFVARGDDFKAFVEKVSALVMDKAPANVDALSALPLEGGNTVEQVRQALVAKIGENIQVRRFTRIESSGYIGSYSHGGRIGVLVELDKANQELAKDIAMHVAASRPVCISEQDVPAEHLAKEKEILIAQASQSNKPADIIEKMVEGRIKKYLAEVTLLGQPFVKDPEQSVGKLLKAASANVKTFIRFEVGEGIEKKQQDFAEEVMAQVKAG
ncbi:MAG: elongation factor Ts [Gammaproteobacteria bacterium]|nr:elongation factor Ts [Gammaproteobacteria bacterium]